MSQLESRAIKFPSKQHKGLIPITAIPGHFATNHSHINYFIDLTNIKARQNDAAQCAHALARKFMHTEIDTIVCLDGTNVIGAYLAQELGNAGYSARNLDKSLYVVQPEYMANGHMLFRENVESMLRDKNVLLLMASVTTGISVRRGFDAVSYYGGKICGVATIFSATNRVDRMEIHSLYTPDDIDGYNSYDRKDCPYCKNGEKVEALVNSFGYSKL